MNKSWTKHRVIIIAVILIIALLCRNIFSSLRTSDHSSQTSKPKSSEFNRNIEHLIITRHAKCRMQCRDITKEEVKEILHDGVINYNKSDLNSERGATYALEGYSHEHQHLRIVFAPKSDELVVVTCIDLDNEWQCDCN